MSKTYAKKSEYPLQWPEDISRTENPERNNRFDTTLHRAMGKVEKLLELMAKDSGIDITDITFTSNVTLGTLNSEDKGVCVYYTWGTQQMCIPVDRYDRVEHNLIAIHHMLEADRTKVRHGGVEFVMAEKRGKMNLLGDGSKKNWWDVLDIGPHSSMSQISERYRNLVKKHHPDKPSGNMETFKEIKEAFEQAKKSVRS